MRILRSGRNGDALSADDRDEMTLFDRVDHDAIDVLASGVVPPGRDDLNDVVWFAAALEDAAMVSPRPSPELAALLVEGFSPTESDLVGSSVRGQSRKRIRPVLETALAKLASLGVAAKVSVASAAVLAATTGAGATGALPGPVQDTMADVVSTVSPFEIPRSGDAGAPGDAGVTDDAGAPEDAGVPDHAGAPEDVTMPDRGDPAANDHGQAVSNTARTTVAEGCDKGHEVAKVAGGDPAACADGGEAAAAPAAPKPDAGAERDADEGEQGDETAADAAEAGQDAADAAIDPPVAARSQGQPDAAGEPGADAAADGAANADAPRP